MTAVQMGLTIAVCTAATMLTRFLPFLIFSSKEQQPPEVVRYLGRVLPAAIFGMRCWRPSRCINGSTRPCSAWPGARFAMYCWCSWCSEKAAQW